MSFSEAPNALFSSNEKLFEPYISQENDQIIPEYQNKTGFYTPYTLDVSVIIANSALTKDIKIEGYNDLLNPKLKEKLLLLIQVTHLAPLLN